MGKYLVQYFHSINRFKTFEIDSDKKYKSSIQILNQYYSENRYFFIVLLNYIYLYDTTENYNVSRWLDSFLEQNIYPISKKILFDTPEILVSLKIEIERAFVNLLFSSRTYIESVFETPYVGEKYSKYKDFFWKELNKHNLAYFVFRILRNNYAHNNLPTLNITSSHGNLNPDRLPESEMKISISKENFMKTNEGAIKSTKIDFTKVRNEINISECIDEHMNILRGTNKKIWEQSSQKLSWNLLKESTEILCSKEIDLRSCRISIIDTIQYTHDVIETLRKREYKDICSIRIDILKICEFLFINFDSKRFNNNPY
jgi:hypothetical protein